MTAKVRIKAGPIEFEYEGETEFSVADIKDLFTHIETLFKGQVTVEGDDVHAPLYQAAADDPKPNVNGSTQKLHVNSIASKLKAKSGAEVALAAAVSLQIMDGKETFTRGELLATMKKATMHYKDPMSGNLSSMLKNLVGSKLNQIGEGVYSLNAGAFKELEAQLA